MKLLPPMYIKTESGVLPCEMTEVDIVLDYYDRGHHELLEIAQDIGIDDSHRIVKAIVYQKLDYDESIILPEKD